MSVGRVTFHDEVRVVDEGGEHRLEPQPDVRREAEVGGLTLNYVYLFQAVDRDRTPTRMLRRI